MIFVKQAAQEIYLIGFLTNYDGKKYSTSHLALKEAENPH